MFKNKFFPILFILLAFAVLVGLGYWYYSQREYLGVQDPLLKKIKSQGRIIIGTEASYPPMESIDEEGNFIGMDIDIAKRIADSLGVIAEFRDIPWNQLFEAVKTGEADMIISAITITTERAQDMDFSDPYFNAGQIVVVKRNGETTIQGPEDLRGKRVGAQIGTTSYKEAREHTEEYLVRDYESYDLAKDELLRGEIDAIIIDYPAGLGMVGQEPDLVIVGEPFTQEFYGIAVQKNQKVLLAEINEVLRRLKKEGELQRLEAIWLSQ